MPYAHSRYENSERGNRIAFDEVDWSSNKDVRDFFLSRRGDHQIMRHQYEKQWFLNQAWYAGHQYLEWSDDQQTLVRKPAPPWRINLTLNEILPIVRTTTSVLLKMQPSWQVIPSTSEQEDEDSSRIGSQVLEFYWRRLMGKKRYKEALGHVLTTGNVFLKVGWDPFSKPFDVTVSDFNNKYSNGDGDKDSDDGAAKKIFRKLTGRKKTSEPFQAGDGDPVINVISPYEMIVDPIPDNLEECEWIVWESRRSLRWAKERWPAQASKLMPDTKGEESYRRKIRTLASVISGNRNTNPQDYEDSVNVFEMWVKPNNKAKRGRVVTIVNDRVVDNHDWPKGIDELPFVHIREIPVPSRFWATSTVEMILEIQRNINRGASQAIEMRNMMLNTKWAVPTEANLTKDDLTDEPGEKVYYSGDRVPSPIPSAEIPRTLFELHSILRGHLHDIASVHDPIRGQPGSTTAASAIALLQEKDSDRFDLLGDELQDGFEYIGRILLKIISVNVEDPRIIKIVGKNMEVETRSFKGSDLTGSDASNQEFDVIVKMGNALPKSLQARKDFVLSLVQEGILNPEDDKDIILRALGMSSEREIMDESLVFRDAIKRNILKMKSGQPSSPMVYHDNVLAAKMVQNFMNTSEFERLGGQIQMLFFQYLMQVHQMINPSPQPAVDPSIMGPASIPLPAQQQQVQQEPQGQSVSPDILQAALSQESPF